ncbi:MAG: S49 family peptidase, partial [Sandarakinorhabdus sp.]|nr:S49 family peptidase [Sandarakinorhabdus sp.]
MQFLKSVWTFLVGVKDALVLILLVMLFGTLWTTLSTISPVATVPEGAALHIELDGILVDQAQERPLLATLTGEQIVPETETARLVRAIDLAAKDSSIRMIALDLDGFLGGGLANLESVGAALTRFRATGKVVETWATVYGDDGYFLAAHADSIGLSPMGAVLLTGPGGSGLYFRDALDRLKVNVEVFRVGTYKSFVEPFTRNESSPEARAADQMLADDLWASWRGTVQRQRQELDINALLAGWPARIAGANRSQALLARDAGLVDVVQSDAAWHRKLRENLGEGDNPDLP